MDENLRVAVRKRQDYTLPLLVGAGVGLYFLLKPSPKVTGKTVAALIPRTEAPLTFPTIGAVGSRFEDVLTLYRMGRFTPAQTLAELNGLVSAVGQLRARGIGEPESAGQLLTRMNAFIKDVQEYVKWSGAQGLGGGVVDEKLRVAVGAAAYYARHLHHDMRVSRDRAVRVAARAVVRAARKEAAGAGMGFPALASGFPLIAAGSIVSGVGWALHLLKG